MLHDWFMSIRSVAKRFVEIGREVPCGEDTGKEDFDRQNIDFHWPHVLECAALQLQKRRPTCVTLRDRKGLSWDGAVESCSLSVIWPPRGGGGGGSAQKLPRFS